MLLPKWLSHPHALMSSQEGCVHNRYEVRQGRAVAGNQGGRGGQLGALDRQAGEWLGDSGPGL